MSGSIKLSKSDVRRAMVRHHFAPCDGLPDAFDRLRSIQLDPLEPAGCNHDLVLQARVPGYKVGDWQKPAYEDRLVYDGWDKMASLVPFDGWPLRRHIYTVHRRKFEKKIFEDHNDAVKLILKEIENRGPLMPKECEFQERREEWKGSWFGPSVTKQTLRALWHSGLVMTAGRKNGQHLYDLTERVVPEHLFNKPVLEAKDAVRELILERHRAVGILRPAAPPEIWSNEVLVYDKRNAIDALLQRGEIVPVDVDGASANATPAFLSLLDQPPLEPRVIFIAPLDQFMWDRKMIAHAFGFDYVWEVYVPESKRRWGYYMLPVLYGDALVARVEFWRRDGMLEIRRWIFESEDISSTFFVELERSLRDFMDYCSATSITAGVDVPATIRDLAKSLSY